MIAVVWISDGELVRVKTVDEGKPVGTVSKMTSNGAGLSFPSGALESIFLDEMESLHRSIGRRTHRKPSVWIGVDIGVLTGIAIGVTTDETCEAGWIEIFSMMIRSSLVQTTEHVMVSVSQLVWYPASSTEQVVPTGLIVSFCIKGERWQDVSVSDTGSTGFEPRIGIRANGCPVLMFK